MNPLVMYHGNCTDGFGAAFAAWKALGNEAEYVTMDYGSGIPVPDVVGRDVYILDFSFDYPTTFGIFCHANTSVWLDHHRTAFEMWCDRPASPWAGERKFYKNDGIYYVILNNNKSGALLAWEYFHPGTAIPFLIRRIDDRDRWQFMYDDSAALHAALQSLKPWSFAQWDSILNWPKGKLNAFLREGGAILRAQRACVGELVEQAQRCTIRAGVSSWLGLAVNATQLHSEVGHVLAEHFGTYGLVWRMEGHKANCSLRSVGAYDVSVIAKAFGGGGHLNAAGFQVDLSVLLGWMK